MEDKLLQSYRTLAGDGNFSWEELAKEAGITAHELRVKYPTRQALDLAAWRDMLFLTIARVKSEPVYAEYTARERMLSFYFTLVEQLKRDRKFSIHHLSKVGILDLKPYFLADFIRHYEAFVTEVLTEGMDRGEIPRRMWVSDQYAKIHFLQTLFLLRTWAEDKSEGFAETDKAIEKAVNLGFDLMERNFIDSTWDFGKYLWSRN